MSTAVKLEQNETRQQYIDEKRLQYSLTNTSLPQSQILSYPLLSMF